MNRPAHRRLVPLLAALVATTAAPAADDPATLRDEYLKSVASSTRMLDDVYRLTLRRLEKQRAEAGDYEGAQNVRERLDQIEKSSLAAPVVPKNSNMVLAANRARTMNGANTDTSRQAVSMRRSGSTAAWDLIGLTQGSYEVYVTFAVGLSEIDPTGNKTPATGCGGVISFAEETRLATQQAAPLERRLHTTGAWDNFVREKLGTIEFRSSSATVKLTTTSAEPGGCAVVRQIELVRASQPATAPTATAATPGSLAEVRAQHRQELRKAAGDVDDRYRQQFEALEREFTSSGNTKAAEAVAEERKRLFPDKPDAAE